MTGRWGTVAAVCAAALVAAGAVAQPPKRQAATAKAAKGVGAAFFAREVRPILSASCWSCHAGAEASGGLDLTNRDAILKGGASGPAVVLGKRAAESLLLKAVHFDGRQMPPQGKLSAPRIAALEKWVALGLPWSAPEAAKTAASAAAPVHHGPPPVNATTKNWWAFRPVKRPDVPAVKDRAWVRTPVDAFVLARLEKSGLAPAPPASRAALIRRATFDVWGLPPTPDEVRAFVSDTSPDAWEKVVDRLLASPHYGERWGRHWLDLVRYAETNSFERDGDKPFVWRYRDWVIRAFNADMPYDRFVREQLAGDELPGRGPDALIATGYYRLGQWDDEPSDPEQARYDEIDDIVSTTSQAFLGLTVGCARCHDHKIDPIPQKDYYRFAALFQNVTRYGMKGGVGFSQNSLRLMTPDPDAARKNAPEIAAYNAALAGVESRIARLEDLVRPTLGGGEIDDFRYDEYRPMLVKKRVGTALTPAQHDEYVKLSGERDRLRKAPPKGMEMALVVSEKGRECREATHILLRGSAHAPGDVVTPGFLSVLSPPEPKIAPPADPDARSTGRRAALADWIASPANPLTARVMANRVFQHHFGRGIVRTPSNFGFLGSAPTHPELLDYLASELVRGGWRLKPLHRQILLSRAYRMASRPDPRTAAKARTQDPENDLLWRFEMRRLEAEEVRDAILAVNGSLNPKRHGPSVAVALPAEVLAGQSVPGAGWKVSAPEEQTRRSVYVKVKRTLSVPILASFDAADVDAPCPVRFTTTQPTQALGMLNSAFVNEQARVFADFARRVAGEDPTNQARFVLSRTLQREPTAAEVKRAVGLMTTLRRDHGRTPDEALSRLCLVALNLNEFVYLD